MLVSAGLEVYNIAKDVYTAVSSAEMKDTSAEDLYIASTAKITNLTMDQVAKRLDCRAVAFPARKYRALKVQLAKTRTKLRSKANRLRARSLCLYRCCLKATTTALRQTKDLATRTFRASLQALWRCYYRLFRASPTLSTYYLFKTDTGSYSTSLGHLALKIIGTIKAPLVYIYRYFNSTVALNDESLKGVANYSFNSACNGLKTNWELFLEGLKLNEQLLNKYFSELEFEIYYAPGKSIKLIDIIKEYIEDITLDVREQESIIVENERNSFTRSHDDLMEAEMAKIEGLNKIFDANIEQETKMQVEKNSKEAEVKEKAKIVVEETMVEVEAVINETLKEITYAFEDVQGDSVMMVKESEEQTIIIADVVQDQISESTQAEHENQSTNNDIMDVTMTEDTSFVKLDESTVEAMKAEQRKAKKKSKKRNKVH